jgi:toxoflavin synthase
MTTNYDAIAEQYQRSKLQPWREFIESPSLLDLIGDLHGLSVVDIACGEGFYTRLLRRLGAAKITGVDLSPGMIELAQKQETAEPLGIEYMVADGRTLELPEPCDLAVAAYLLNYAQDRGELQAMCDGIARCLKPGGRFVTVNGSPVLNFSAAPSYREYGFETRVVGDWQEGAPIRWVFHLDDGLFEIENYHLDQAIHEQAFRAAGFREIRWFKPTLSSAGQAALPSGNWDIFLNDSPIMLIECVK